MTSDVIQQSPPVQPSLWGQWHTVHHNYATPPEQHRAKGLLQMARGSVVAVTLGILFQLIDTPDVYVFEFLGIPFNDNRIFYALLVLSAYIGSALIVHHVQRGNLHEGSRSMAIMMLFVAVFAYLPLHPSDAIVIVMTLPLVATGVLLDRRSLVRMGWLVGGIIVLRAVLGMTDVFVVIEGDGRLQFEEVAAFGSLVIFVNVVMLHTFSGSRILLLEERVKLVDELQTLNTELEDRVQRRTSQLAEAMVTTENALQQALEADKLKSRFLASMSHELRTPLNSILTFSELLEMGTFGDVSDEQSDYLGKILFSGRHLLALINDVLDITKIQSGMLKLFVEEDFHVNAEMDNIVDTARNLLGGKEVNVVTDIEHFAKPLTCDKRRVRQILLNLISNAVKFTDEGQILISAKRVGDEIHFAVIDSGPGVPTDMHDVIFEPFEQTEAGLKLAGGTGLGLPISRQLAEAHGGRLWLDSAAGEGAAFYVALPLNMTIIPENTDS